MFKKSVVVGVSVTPETGLEVIQIDYSTKTILKYGRKELEYNIVRRDISDIDLFKQTLIDLLEELEIPKGADLYLSLPAVAFKVTDYPASLDSLQIESAIEEELFENPYLKDFEAVTSYATVNSSLQFNKVAYMATQKVTVVELIIAIKDIGYNVKAIDTSINSILNSLVYMDRVNTESGTSWVLLIIENNCCRILSMLGKNYLDYFEEQISIGEVLSDAENYSTVLNSIEPILKNLPAKYLCIVSKTNVVSAEIIANKLNYSAPIIYQEANVYRKDELLELAPTVPSEYAKTISLDAIGAGIYSEYTASSYLKFNFFNISLGDLYIMEQPPSIMNGKIVLTNEYLLGAFIIFAVVIFAILLLLFILSFIDGRSKQQTITDIERQISEIDSYLNEHKDISGETFDEGDEIRLGLVHNKSIYSYYTIVGTEIPQKLWLTHLRLGDKVTIDGQADNLESVYSFYKNIKDYNPNSDITLQKLGLATKNSQDLSDFDTESILTTLNADFYEFSISNDTIQDNNDGKDKENKNNNSVPKDLELIDENKGK